MAQKCLVCSHLKVDEINKRLLDAQKIGFVANKYKLSYASVWRHKKKHLMRYYDSEIEAVMDSAEKLKKKLANSQDEPIKDQIATSYKFLMEEAVRMYTVCARNGDGLLAVKFMDQARRALDSCVRSIDIFKWENDSLEWKNVQSTVMKALDGHPSAKLSVAQALKAIGSRSEDNRND